ncbi:hypothetical protein QBC33DRAFT_316317 [Phialemonium atrogriseum]|uniref:Bacteriophage T5 Orf172 DNA-binding domain-containing protein n=1 Tax=Phialemonium atrogriseum TaxID=1093897 RepID=A0AAJ0C7Q3_9PEZI|nr:uncharacterized protein QBC33DRAFT_316317 [Phialemonium atrogriseum]KAK1770257.1 hypothetical protein QBC33DRAFT_316317 [Phialemonium atrogriseum]
MPVTGQPNTPPNPRRNKPVTRNSGDSGYHSSVTPGTRTGEDEEGTPSRRAGVDRSKKERKIPDGDETRGNPAAREVKSPYEVDDEISKVIKEQLPDKDLNETNGIPYTFHVRRGLSPTTVVKVGSTTKTIQDRMAQLEKLHKNWQYNLAPGVNTIPVRHYLRVERLAQKELLNHRVDQGDCLLCPTNHREYFLTNSDVAIAAVNRWRRFCDAEPYDEAGCLRPFWARRLERRIKPHEEETEDDHAGRGERWDCFIRVSWMSYVLYDVECFVRAVRTSPLRWRWCSFVQALAYLLLPGVVSWAVSLAVVGYFFVEESAFGRELARYVNALFDLNYPKTVKEGDDAEVPPLPLPPWVSELVPEGARALMPCWLPRYLPAERPQWLKLALSERNFPQSKKSIRDLCGWWKKRKTEYLGPGDTSASVLRLVFGDTDVLLLESLLVAFVLSRTFYFISGFGICMALGLRLLKKLLRKV